MTKNTETNNPPLTIEVRGVVASTMRQHTSLADSDPASNALTRCVEIAGQFGSASCSMTRDDWNNTLAAVREVISKNPDDKYNQKLARYIAEIEAPLAEAITRDKHELGREVAMQMEGLQIRINSALDALPDAEKRENDAMQKMRDIIREHENTADRKARLAAATADHNSASEHHGNVRKILQDARDDLRKHADELDYVLA